MSPGPAVRFNETGTIGWGVDPNVVPAKVFCTPVVAFGTTVGRAGLFKQHSLFISRQKFVRMADVA